jgi:uncharacterized protein YecT (DUF1311 family)
MLSFSALALAASSVAPCPGDTTLQVEACLEARLAEGDALLNRYYQVALMRARERGGSETARLFVQAQRNWIAFRNAECASVRHNWRDGTIRGSMDLGCRILLTRLRTYSMWRDWLTYPDSTPPSLPRPDVESVTAER